MFRDWYQLMCFTCLVHILKCETYRVLEKEPRYAINVECPPGQKRRPADVIIFGVTKAGTESLATMMQIHPKIAARRTESRYSYLYVHADY